MDVFNVTIGYLWVFTPQSAVGEEWLRRNFFKGDRLAVDPWRGPNVRRALQADGFAVEESTDGGSPF